MSYQKAFGTSFWLQSLDDPTTLLNVGFPGTITNNRTRETADVTNHQSPQETREFVATLKVSGEYSFPCKLGPGMSGYSLLEAHRVKDDPNGKAFRTYFPNGTYVEGYCHVTGVSDQYPIDDVMGCDVTVQLTGPVMFYSDQDPSPADLYT